MIIIPGCLINLAGSYDIRTVRELLRLTKAYSLGAVSLTASSMEGTNA